MNNTLHIRPIEKKDDPVIARIIRTVLEEHGVNMPGTAYYDKSLDEMTTAHAIGNSAYFIGSVDGEIMGGAGIYPTDGLPEGTCELVKMYLLPQARGRGLGKALVQHCLSFAREKGYQNIYLETMPQLQKAVSMYEKMGFVLLNGPLGNTGHFACNIRMIKRL